VVVVEHRRRTRLAVSSHGDLGTSVLAEHLGRKMRLVPQEELVVIRTKLGAAGHTDKVPVNVTASTVESMNNAMRLESPIAGKANTASTVFEN